MRHSSASRLLLAVIIIGCLYAADTGITNATAAIQQTARDFLEILPALSMVLVILGAVTYAAGKMIPNPEFAGKASGLAAAAIAASVISLVIYLVLPPVLKMIYPEGNFDLAIAEFE